MKVIFLDIDGVMNSHIFYEQRYKKWTSIQNRTWNFFKSKIKYILNGFKHKYTNLLEYKIPDSSYTFDYQFKRLLESTCSEKWKWLSEFCNENDIKICISSVWKRHFGDKECTLPERWDEALTKLGFKPNTFVGITGSRRTLRGEEIKEWLDEHKEVTDYVILDDDSDMLPEQMCKFHHCDPWFGMSPNHLYRIKRQFDNKGSYEKLSKSLEL